MSPPESSRPVDESIERAKAFERASASADAESLYRQILDQNPRHAEAALRLGTLLLRLGRAAESVSLLTLATSGDFMRCEAYSNLACAFNATGRYEEALANAEQACALEPDSANALINRGNALKWLGRFEEALLSYERALVLQPSSALGWNNRASVLLDLGRADEALRSCDEALQKAPRYADAWSVRGNALKALDRLPEALDCYRRALELEPGHYYAWSNQGLVLGGLHRHREALQCYERAIALRPDLAQGHWNEALCRLRLGQFEQGWRLYEWRWQQGGTRWGARRFVQPLWLGDAPLAGKTILLHAEQGLGDTLQFCRYAALVARLGARVVLEVQPELVGLLAGLEGVSEIVAAGDPLPSFDVHCPLLSLPLALGTRVDSIPAVTPYLFAKPELARHWRARMGEAPAGLLRVGIVWAGGARLDVPEQVQVDALRSLGLERLRPMLEMSGVQFYSLQIGPPAQQLKAWNAHGGSGQRIVDLTDDIRDFSDTAAIVDCLDLVISVDTSTAHLAGALGKPVWVLNRFDACWRWMIEREDSPWYPTLRLFNQPARGDWGSVIEAVRRELAELLSRRTAGCGDGVGRNQ
jgi:tetratricopeptide (TPR) repeat protein